MLERWTERSWLRSYGTGVRGCSPPTWGYRSGADILAWNTLATALYTDFSAIPPFERNVIRWHFAQARSVIDDAEADRLGRELVADLRAAAGRHRDDPEIRDLVAELHAASAEFAELWSAHKVAVQRSTVKHMTHPVVGPLELDSQTLLIPERDQRLVFYTAAPGTPSHQALQLLRVIGTQDLEPQSRHGAPGRTRPVS